MNPKRHPPRRRLQQWLEGDAPRRVNRHVDRCQHCQGLLEELSALDEDVIAELLDAVSPPEDLEDRTADGVEERLRDEAAIGVFLDLFTVGWATTRAIVDPEAHLNEAQADEDTGDQP